MTARVFAQLASVEARKRLTYRADFWLSALVGFGAQVGISYFIATALFAGAGRGEIGGYSRDALVVYYVAVALLGKIVRATDMEMLIATDIYEGGLTRYLLYPAPYVAVKYAQQVGALLPLLVQLVLFGAWVPFVLGAADGVALGPGTAARCVAATAAANLLHFLIAWPIQAVAFWADNVWSLVVALRIGAALFGGMLVPIALFPQAAQTVLAWSPFPYLFSFPVETLLGRLTPAAWAQGMAMTLGWCVVMACAGRALWRRGELAYTGVGI